MSGAELRIYILRYKAPAKFVFSGTMRQPSNEAQALQLSPGLLLWMPWIFQLWVPLTAKSVLHWILAAQGQPQQPVGGQHQPGPKSKPYSKLSKI
jgi:hypothetical protein